MQPFEPQYDHNPNLSISTIISTSCVILDGSNDSRFGHGGGVQGALAGAVATTSVLPSQRCEFERGYSAAQTNRYQPAEMSEFCPVSGGSSFGDLDIGTQPLNHFSDHPFESEMYDFTSWAGSNGVSERAGQREAQKEVLPHNSLASGHVRNNADWAKCSYTEHSVLQDNCDRQPSGPAREVSETGEGDKYLLGASSVLQETACGSNPQDQGIHFLQGSENFSDFDIDTSNHYKCMLSEPVSTQVDDISDSNQLDGFQNHTASWMHDTCAFPQDYTRYSCDWAPRFPPIYPTTSTGALPQTSLYRKSELGLTQDHSVSTSSSCQSSSDASEDQHSAVYTDDSAPSFVAATSTDMLQMRSDKTDGRDFQLQVHQSGANSSGVSRKRGHDQEVFTINGAPQMYGKSDSTFSSVDFGKETTSNREHPPHIGWELGKPPLDAVTRIKSTRMNKADGGDTISSSKTARTETVSSAGNRSKKKADSVESLQRQLLLLEEQRTDAGADARHACKENTTGSCHSNGDDAHDHVVVDVDHMICSGVTVAGFKPRATIRKRNKVAISREDKDTGYWHKRRKNNDSARKSREAKKEKEKSFYKRALELEYENLYLQRCLRVAEAEMAALGQPLVLPPLSSNGYF